MDAEKLKAALETIELDDDVSLALSTISDQLLTLMASRIIQDILRGESHPKAALGGLLAVGMEALQRRITKEKSNG